MVAFAREDQLVERGARHAGARAELARLWQADVERLVIARSEPRRGSCWVGRMLGFRRSFRGISEAIREFDFIVSDDDATQKCVNDLALRF